MPPWRRQADRTELVHVVVTGHLKRKYPNKYYVFVIDVTWNNSERFEIYRRYSDFFSFQTTLKAIFPYAAGRRNTERTIPQLPKRIFVGRSHVARVAEARVEQINRYCQTLVSLDTKVSQSSHVIGFFSPRISDKPLPKLHLHRPASLHPQKTPAGSLFEEYCALAEYEAEDPSQVSFTSGQIVLVLAKHDESGWWMGQVSGKVGWVPPSYLKKVDKGDSTEGESDSDDEYLGLPGFVDPEKEAGLDSGFGSPPTDKEGLSSGVDGFKVPEIEFEEYKAIDSYEAQGDGQVSFEEGDIIQVLDKIEDGWWFVAKGQEEGWVPCSYLEPLKVGQDEDNTISSLDVERYITVETYKAEEEDEISFPKGVIVDVLQKSLDGWWLIKHDGKAALAPATFLVKKETNNEDSPTIARKASNVSLVDTHEQEGGVKPQSKDEQVKTQAKEKGVNTITRASYRQPPRKQSVRRRVSKRKSRLLGGQFGLATQAIREESPSPIPSSQARKLSLENTDPVRVFGTSPTKHSAVGRKLSEQTTPTQSPVKVNPNLPGQRKISLDAALSGAPKFAPNGALVHQTKKAPAERPTFLMTSVDSDTEDHEYLNIDPQSYQRENGQQMSTELHRKVGSPITSDSDVDTSSSWAAKSGLGASSKLQQQQQLGNRSREVKGKIRQWERRPSSDSEDSISSPPTSITRRPIAAPRATKPALKPKPKLVGNQKVPPRPRMSQIDRARGKAGAVQKEETQLQVEQQPRMPSRPRGTEIRRARQAKQPTTSPVPPSQTPTPPPSTPIITATNYEGDRPVIPSSKNSAFKAINARRSPSPSRPGLAVVREERETEMSTSASHGLRPANQRPRSPRGKSPSRTPNSPVSSMTSSLSPLTPSNSPNTPRKDHNHTGTAPPDASTSPSPSPGPTPSPLAGLAIGGDGNPLNQQMAETLIKYILASQDSGLKNALCECIMSNPEAVKALQK